MSVGTRNYSRRNPPKKRRRKTVHVNSLIDRANAYLSNEDIHDVPGKELLSYFLEDVLMQTNNYRGFRYNTNDNAGKHKFCRSYIKGF